MSLENSNPAKYHADIDGLRAIAVLAVMFYHADTGFPGGYVGVDVFFVISGYLITGLILKDLDRGQFRILKFWERRMRRIQPALVVVVLPCLATGWFLLFPQGFKELGEAASAQALLMSNIYFWIKAQVNLGYFVQLNDVNPLLHTWSLAVEEQFYLLLPFPLIILHRYSRKSLVPAILLLCGISFSLSVYCSYRHPSVNFYLLPTRAWELLIGSFLAAIPAQRASSRWLTEPLGWCGLLAILYAVFFYDRETRFPGVAAILPCVGAALVIWANGHTLTSTGRLLAMPPLVFIGLISYSLYLWHWPVLVFSKYWAIEAIPLSQRMLLLLASVVIAILSWRFVETPFRNRVILPSRSQVFSFAGITTATLFLTGLAIHQAKGLPSRTQPDALRYLNGEMDPAFVKNVDLKKALNGDFIELGKGDKDLPIDLLVWGDSHAMSALPVVDILCKEHSLRGVAAMHAGRAPLVGYTSHHKAFVDKEAVAVNNAVVEFIRSHRVGDVVLVARWDAYIDNEKGTDRIRSGVLATLNALDGSGARIWIMRQVPKQSWHVPRALASAVYYGRDLQELGLPLSEYRKEFQRQGRVFEGLATMFPGVTVLDPTDMFVTPKGRCRVAEGGKALYCDQDHLTVAGAMVLRPMFVPLFEVIGKSPATVQDKGISK